MAPSSRRGAARRRNRAGARGRHRVPRRTRAIARDLGHVLRSVRGR